MNNDKLIAIDLAKSVFQVCQLDSDNKVLVNKKLSRQKLGEFLAKQQPSTVVMEACYSAHYWGRKCEELGHIAKLIPAQHVKPFVRGNKNDANDALAIAEATRRPNLRFVPIKTIEQQDIQSLHRIRERLISNRLALSNQTRGLLSNYGVIAPLGYAGFNKALVAALDNPQLSVLLKQQLHLLYDEYTSVCSRLQNLDKQIKEMAQHCGQCRVLMSMPGIGPIISTAIISSINVTQHFQTPREFAVWLGVTPRQFSSGNRSTMQGITKRGNRYLRKQLVHGARAAMRWCRKRNDRFSRWVNDLVARRGFNKAVVALAHKMARLCWVLLQRNEPFVTTK